MELRIINADVINANGQLLVEGVETLTVDVTNGKIVWARPTQFEGVQGVFLTPQGAEIPVFFDEDPDLDPEPEDEPDEDWVLE